ncbi:MAG: hypothetical protein U0X92_05210 [Anaerolineales bacterium]
MEFDPKDNLVVVLLAKLKLTEIHYPTELFAPRRQKFLECVLAFGLSAGKNYDNSRVEGKSANTGI